MNQSLIMRVSRTTIAYGPDQTVLCHPYSLWMKDEHAKVHHGSVVFPITNQQMEDQSIKYRYLVFLNISKSLRRLILFF